MNDCALQNMLRLRRHGIFGLLLVLSVFLVSLDVPATAAKKRVRRKSKPSAEAVIRTPEQWASSVARAEERLDERWTVSVVDLLTSRTVFEYHPERRLMPASNRKLITFGMALEFLGPDYRFKTQFGLVTPRRPGQSHYHGDLVLKSAGDPSLGFPFREGAVNPASLFKQWAEALKRAGVDYVHGDLRIDATAFGHDQNAYPGYWPQNYRNSSYAPVPSAIAICQNLLRISIRPGSSPGRAGRVRLYPSDEGVSIVNQVITRSSGATGISSEFSADLNQLNLTGRVNDDAGEEVTMAAIPRPLEYVGAMMSHALSEAGVRLLGETRIFTDPDDFGTTSTLAEVISVHESPQLMDILTIMMRTSNNFLAEQVWRAAAVQATGRGDLTTTREIEQRWYRRKGASWIEPGWDGSGLSRENRNDAHEFTRIMRDMYESGFRDFLLLALPESGRNGTLRNRSFDKGTGRVTAKTGTLNDVSALTGFINDRGGDPRFVFSVIGNARDDSSSRLAGRINQLLAILIRQLDNAPALMEADSEETERGG